MKLFPLNPVQRLALNIKKISRKLKIQTIVTKSASIKDIVIIANGTPDDIVFSIIAYHQNGKKIVGIVKPEKTRLGVIDFIPSYIKQKIRNLMILIDQEDDELENLFDQIEEKFVSIGIRADLVDKQNRLRLYKCKYAANDISIILVINGLDDIKTKKHTIEDHLVKALSIFEGDSILKKSQKLSSSKDIWNSINKSLKERILKRLCQEKNVLKQIFPQHIFGCSYLESVV